MKTIHASHKQPIHFSLGILLTLFIAIAAQQLASLPLLNVTGHLVLAIMIGMIWRATIGLPGQLITGTTFSSKKLLRLGIILLGMRLDFVDIFSVGIDIFIIASVSLMFTLIVVFLLTKRFKVERRLGILTACGTAICGAAAIVAIAPQLKAKDEEIAIGAATVAILGTIFTVVYTIFFPVIGLSAHGYGVFSGATLHELAHVIAAAAPAGNQAVDTAVIVKLTRVALLVPVAIVIGIWMNYLEARENHRNEKKRWRAITIPWFIVGFLVMSAVHSLGLIPASITSLLLSLSYLLIAMAMAGLGLSVNITMFRRLGLRPFAAALIGSILLSGIGFALVHAFDLV